MRRAIAVGALVGGILACERVCGELEPLPASATGGVDAGSALPDAEGTGGMGGLGQTTGGSTGDPSGAGGMGSGGIAGSTTQPPGGSGGASGCRMYPADTNGVLRIINFPGGVSSSSLGMMVSDLGEPNPPDPPPDPSPDGYSEGGMVSPAGAEFSFVFVPCIDARDYASVQFDHSASTEPPDDMTFSIVVASGTSLPPASFQPGAGQFRCFPLGPARQNITALRWTYPALMSSYTVDITINNVVFDTADCSTGGTGGMAGSGGRGGVGGS